MELVNAEGNARERLLVRIFSRSLGMVVAHSFETEDEIVTKFFPDRSTIVKFVGTDEFDQPVNHYFQTLAADKSGDIAALVVVPMKDRKVIPVEARPVSPRVR